MAHQAIDVDFVYDFQSFLVKVRFLDCHKRERDVWELQGESTDVDISRNIISFDIEGDKLRRIKFKNSVKLSYMYRNEFNAYNTHSRDEARAIWEFLKKQGFTETRASLKNREKVDRV